MAAKTIKRPIDNRLIHNIALTFYRHILKWIVFFPNFIHQKLEVNTLSDLAMVVVIFSVSI